MNLTARLLVFNLLLAVFPVAAILFLDTYESQLLEIQESAMVQQGRILASALEGQSDIEEQAQRVLGRLGGRTDSRLRIVNSGGLLLADSASLPGEPESGAAESEHHDSAGASVQLSQPPDAGTVGSDEQNLATENPEERLLYRISVLPVRLYRSIVAALSVPENSSAESEFYSGETILDGPEILAALEGRYGAATRISRGQRSVTLYSAIPVVHDGQYTGAVLVSRSTRGILSNLYRLRTDIATIFLLSVAVAIVLSLILSRTITVPVKRLRDQAEGLLDEQGKILDQFRPLSGADEVADLSHALYDLSRRLRERTEHVEDFIADLVHEMKNPVAGILSAAEIAQEDEKAQGRFIDVTIREGQRIDRLLDDLRELIRVDIRLDRSAEARSNPGAVLSTILSSYSEHKKRQIDVTLTNRLEQERSIKADPDRLAQALLNLLDNAVSFSPPGGQVDVDVWTSEDQNVCIDVKDSGPGIAQADKTRIFERWYSDRPQDEAVKHTGLGLAIVKGIAEGYGGTITAFDREGGGAVFRLELPL